MTNYLEAKISDITDPSFQGLIAELCHCVNWDTEEFVNRRLAFLLMAIGKEGKALTLQHLPGKGILTTRVDKLSPDSAVYHVCWQLANLNRTHIESFDGKTVLTLIKNCYKIYWKKPAKRKPARRGIF